MSLSAGDRVTTLDGLGSKKSLLYVLFVFLSGLSVALAIFNEGYLISLIPLSVLVLAYARYIGWQTLLKVYLAILFLIPIESYKLIGNLPVDIELNRVFAAVLLMFWIALLLVDPNIKIKKTGLEAPLLALSVSLAVSLLVNLDSYSNLELTAAIKAIALFFIYIIIFYFISSVLNGYAQVESLAKWLVFLAVIIGSVGIAERLTGYNPFKHLNEVFPFLIPDMRKVAFTLNRGELRITSSADHPVNLAALLSMFLALAFFFFNKSKNVLQKAWYGISLGVILIGSIFTVSATAIVGLIVILISQIFVNPRRGLVVVLVVILFALASNMFFHNDYAQLTDRMSYNWLTQNEVGNPNGRLADYPRVWKEFLDRPFFGRGFGTFDPEKHFYIDNQYLGFMVETGIVGTLCFLWLFYALVKKLKGVISKSTGDKAGLAGALLSSILVFIIVCTIFDTFGFKQVSYSFFILAAFGSVLDVCDGL